MYCKYMDLIESISYWTIDTLKDIESKKGNYDYRDARRDFLRIQEMIKTSGVEMEDE